MSLLQKAVYLDRDGTIIIDKVYLSDPAEVELIQGVGEALATLSELGYLLVLITNQSGIGRGLFSEQAVESQHERLQELLAHYNVQLDLVKFCPHKPEDHCACRKPSPKMLVDAAKILDIDLNDSFMIGDKSCDVLAGRRAGCKTILIGSNSECDADFCVECLSDAVVILSLL